MTPLEQRQKLSDISGQIRSVSQQINMMQEELPMQMQHLGKMDATLRVIAGELNVIKNAIK